ncbi:hypothetical protein NIES4102_35820 [Chondrocystis sp. NIES-4102]|nr:hypothetical protein NIES4102_35820 [Chondrocystis sp. NIES-4102]
MMKNNWILITTLGCLLSATSVNAKPMSCSQSAITPLEKETVKIITDMQNVHTQIETTTATLNKINQQKIQINYKSNEQNLDKYNKLVDEYNKVVEVSNKLSEEYNKLRDSYNALVNKSPISSNIAFTTCINIQVSSLNVATNSHKIDSLTLGIDILEQSINNLK